LPPLISSETTDISVIINTSNVNADQIIGMDRITIFVADSPTNPHQISHENNATVNAVEAAIKSLFILDLSPDKIRLEYKNTVPR
jgi:carbamoylphosphate synthase small subunit